MKHQRPPDSRKPSAVNARDFILSVQTPPAVYAETLLEQIEDMMTPEQIREFILQHQFPPAWGREMESEIQLRLVAAGFSQVRIHCLDEHPVAEVRMRKPADRALTIRELVRLLGRVAEELGATIVRGSVVASIQGDRVEAGLVMRDAFAEPAD
jgi:hypothetical protein